MRIGRKACLMFLLVSILMIITLLTSCTEQGTKLAFVDEQLVTPKPVEKVEPTTKPTEEPTNTPRPTESATVTPQPEVSAQVTQKPIEVAKPSQEAIQKSSEPTQKPKQPTEKPVQPVKEEPKPKPTPKPTEPPKVTLPPQDNGPVYPPSIVQMGLERAGEDREVSINNGGTIVSYKITYSSPGANVKVTINSSKTAFVFYTEKSCYIELDVVALGKDDKNYNLSSRLDFLGEDYGSYSVDSIKKKFIKMYVGEQTPLETIGTPSKWTSSDTSIATVDSNGMVVGVSPGKVYITAFFETGTSTSFVTIK